MGVLFGAAAVWQEAAIHHRAREAERAPKAARSFWRPAASLMATSGG